MKRFKSPKKLIEVALPLDVINGFSAYEKLPGIGAHPRGIHHWWARRPFAAARAIIFCQMVNDPGGERGWSSKKTKEQAEEEREELFEIVRKLADWKESDNQEILTRAKEKIIESWKEMCALNVGNEDFIPDILPDFHDPFAGGGALPLEALRLGLKSNGTDLNPIPVMINKAMLEIPSKFQNHRPIGPSVGKQTSIQDYRGSEGLAEDVRRYGHWINEEVKKQIGSNYPPISINGQKRKVVAWLWARTVESPSPAFKGCMVPLVKSFTLRSKKGEVTYVEPIINNESKTYKFEVKIAGSKPSLEGTINRKGGECIFSGAPIPLKYIREQGKAGKLGIRLLAIVLEGKARKEYVSPTEEQEDIGKNIEILNFPSAEIDHWAGCTNSVVYGLTRFENLFTPRQLKALCVYSDVIKELPKRIVSDALASGMQDDGKKLNQNGSGITALAEAITVYLSFTLDRSADFNNSLTGWRPGNEKIMGLFNRQAIPMVWDFGEANILENVVGGFTSHVDYQSKCIAKLPCGKQGSAYQLDAASAGVKNAVISCDPPYYDNVPYSNISDFFYIWMRRTIKDIYPEVFTTMTVPKMPELVANQFRHSDKKTAEDFFLTGMESAMHLMAENTHPGYPVTIYYAFKQSETQNTSTISTGWETFLEAVLRAGFKITGTWPMRSEQSTRMRGVGANALASSIVLVCRKRELAAETISRREFQRELREKMPDALEAMIGGETGATPIAPVDLAQAAIGPGMAIYSKYAAVLNQDGSKMSVHDALILINRAITDYLNPDSGNFDADTLFCDDWFSQYGWGEGQFGEADTLARAKGTSVDGVRDAGVIEAGGGKVRLLKWSEYHQDWDPKTDTRTPIVGR